MLIADTIVILWFSTFQVLAEVTLRPQLSDEEIEAARQAVAFELETISMRPEQETILMDMIHAVNNDLYIQFLFYYKTVTKPCLYDES